MTRDRRERSFLVPEVLQASSMDCGPAALHAVLAGFGLHVSYDELRERCETDIDGTSIDALAELASELGLETYELLVASDVLLLPEARCLPAIVVTRGGGGLLHFVVVWRAVGPFVQLMDPGGGRRWQHKRSFLQTLSMPAIRLSAQKWRRWVVSHDSLATFRRRMRDLGLDLEQIEALLARAQADDGAHSFMVLDAAIRMVSALVCSRALAKGRQAQRTLQAAFDAELAVKDHSHPQPEIPLRFWWARSDQNTASKLLLRGPVIVHFAARANAAPRPIERRPQESAKPPQTFSETMARASQQPMRALWQLLAADAGARLYWLGLAFVLCALLTPVEAVLLRGLLDLDRQLALPYQRVVGSCAAAALLFVQLLLDWTSQSAVGRIGQRLEARLRVELLHKLPRLDDQYLRTRPTSDMANRAHGVHVLREIPLLWAECLRGLLSLLATSVALLWLYPTGARWIVLLAISSSIAPYLARRSLTETALRLRTHSSALERFDLDALLGATTVRAHGSERAVRSEQESLLTEWVRTARSLHVQSVSVRAIQLLASGAAALWLVYAFWRDAAAPAALLLLTYWALRMPAAAQQIATHLLSLRSLRGVVVRLLAPLTAPERTIETAPDTCRAGTAAVSVRLEDVTVCAGGHALLQQLDLAIRPAEHVAIVGASGAGKSSLLGLLLGFVSATAGRVLVDDTQLDAAGLACLRAHTTWVDPAIRVWDESIYDNLLYASDRVVPIASALEDADLFEVLEKLPDGMQARLGEGGVRVSGGQGQRVRLGRAMVRDRVRLVLLDEPFRGLEREQRRALLHRLRARYRHATLIFVSHDISDTLDLERVVVLEQGKIVEDGSPRELAARPDGSYARLIESDRALQRELWSAASWRKVRVREGRAVEQEAS